MSNVLESARQQGSATPKLAQRLAERIERDILERRLAPGEHLGTETDLLSRFAVSRSVLREALVLVAGSGLAETQRGKNGGLVVSAPSQDMVAAGLQGYIGCISTDFADVRATRRELEDFALSLAISRFQAADIAAYAELEQLYRATSDRAGRLELGARSLALIARTARNPFLAVLVTALSGAEVERLSQTRGGAARRLELADQISGHRQRQLAAVLAADPGRALAANVEVHRLYADMHEVCTDAEEIADLQAQASLLRSAGGQAEPGRLAEALARRLRTRIARAEYDSDGRLGSEQELMGRYGVSRGVLREAIRILERMSLARMVRGKHGGLRAMAPNAAAVVRTSSLYLRSLDVRPRHNQELGEVMGLIAVERAARNAAGYSKPELAAVLQPLSRMKNATLRELAFAHYNAIGQLSGSPAIGMIMSILANLFAFDESLAPDQIVVREIVPERMRDLLDAIVAGDPDLARRRMIILQRSGARVRALSVDEIVRPRLLDIVGG